MKIFTLLIFNFLLSTVTGNAQSPPKEDSFYPCLDMIVRNYENYYFKYPGNIKDLIDFTESLFEAYSDLDNACKNNLILKILPYLEKNMKQVLIEKNEMDAYTIRIGNDTLLHVSSSAWPFSPCEDSLFIGGDSNEYYHFYDRFRSPRFYSSHGKAIMYADSIYQKFEQEVFNIIHKYIVPSNCPLPYKYYTYENDTVPIVSMLEYNLGKPLRYYCSGRIIKSKLFFYKKLEMFLRSFCKLYKCRRLLFTIPDYNLSDGQSLGYNKDCVREGE